MSQRTESPKASIWKAKNDKLADTAPSKGSRITSSKKTTASSSKNQSRTKRSEKKDQRVQYQPKLMTEEDCELKTCLIKIGMRTSIRQVINFSLDKIRKDWTVTFNAFQQDLTKAMQACEIIKTRVPFLYQENKFISWDVPSRDKEEVTADVVDDSKKDLRQRVRTGLSITLSKVKFEVTNVAGYQKPKPRQFLQPLPQKTKPVSKVVESDDDVHQEEQRQKRGGGKGRRARSAQKASKVKNEENKENSHPKRRRGGKKKDAAVEERSHSDERRRFSSQDEYHDRKSAPRGYYHGYRDDSRRRFNKGPQHSKNFDSDYEKPLRGGGYGKMMYHPDSDRFMNDYSGPKNRGPMHNRYHDGGFQSHVPFRERQFKGGPPPNMRGYNYKGPIPRGSEYDKPDRPGYYAGNMRPFRMDKMRNEPLEREERGPQHLSAKEYRDQRNRPSLNERR